MDNGPVMLPAKATVQIRRGDKMEEVVLTEPTWGVMQPLIGSLAEQAKRMFAYLEKGGVQLDGALVANILATTMPGEIILAATGQKPDWLNSVYLGDMPKLIEAAIEVTLHPDLFPGLKKILEKMNQKAGRPPTSETLSPDSPPTASPTTPPNGSPSDS